MSFKRFDPEDVVLSSELITFPTWYSQKEGDTDTIDLKNDVVPSPEQGHSVDYYVDFYSAYTPENSGSGTYDPEHSKPLFSLARAQRPSGGVAQADESGNIPSTNVVFGQYRSLVLGDEYSEFTFGSTVIGNDTEDAGAAVRYADSFVAMTIDRSRFREKLDPSTCEIVFTTGSGEQVEQVVIRPDTSANRRYLDAGRVFDLAKYIVNAEGTGSFEYPEIDGSKCSYGYFLPDIGVILFNTSNKGSLFNGVEEEADPQTFILNFEGKFDSIKLRSQETVTSNFIFVRARNAEFNYSTNPSNIVGSAGNIRWDVMINQPQSFVTTVGLYNDSNELLAVAKLSRPLIKDFTKEALIRIKLDY